MNTRDLEAFLAVVETGSIVGASVRLHLTQPGVSRRIQSLEERLGVALLDRQSKPLKPTAAGRETYAHGRRMLGVLDDLKTGLSPKGVVSGEFRAWHFALFVGGRDNDTRRQAPWQLSRSLAAHHNGMARTASGAASPQRDRRCRVLPSRWNESADRDRGGRPRHPASFCCGLSIAGFALSCNAARPLAVSLDHQPGWLRLPRCDPAPLRAGASSSANRDRGAELGPSPVTRRSRAGNHPGDKSCH